MHYLQSRRSEALHLKEQGNEHYNGGHYEKAIETYTDALAVCLLSHTNDRAILYANRAAAKVKMVNVCASLCFACFS